NGPRAARATMLCNFCFMPPSPFQCFLSFASIIDTPVPDKRSQISHVLVAISLPRPLANGSTPEARRKKPRAFRCDHWKREALGHIRLPGRNGCKLVLQIVQRGAHQHLDAHA